MSAMARVDLKAGVLVMHTGEHVPITEYFGRPDDVPPDGAVFAGYDWVVAVVAGPDGDGDWHRANVTEEDREEAR